MLLAPALRIPPHRIVTARVASLPQLLGQPLRRQPIALALGHVRFEQFVELLYERPSFGSGCSLRS